MLQSRDTVRLSGWGCVLNGGFMLARIDPPRRSPKMGFADIWRLTGLLFGIVVTLSWIAFLGYEALSLIGSLL